MEKVKAFRNSYIIFGVLLVTSVVINLYFFFKKTNPQFSTNETAPSISNPASDYKMLSPHLDNISREDRLVHFSPLKSDIQTYINQYKDIKISVYFEYLNTGSNFSINVDYYSFPASLTKVPISIMIMNKVNKGELSMDTQLPITEKNKDKFSGELYKLPEGTMLSVKELVEANLVASDNTAKNILYGLITPADLNDFINELGMDQLFNENGDTTAKEYARVFRSLYYSSMLKKEDSEYLLDLLSKTNRQKFMTTKLPENVTVAHKYAATIPDKSYSDVGIIYINNRPYLLAVTLDGRDSKNLTQEDAREIIGTISKKTYDYVITK